MQGQKLMLEIWACSNWKYSVYSLHGNLIPTTACKKNILYIHCSTHWSFCRARSGGDIGPLLPLDGGQTNLPEQGDPLLLILASLAPSQLCWAPPWDKSTAQTPQLHLGLDGSSGSEGLAHKPHSYNKEGPLQSPAVRQWEQMPVAMWSERSEKVRDYVLKGKQTAHRLVFALHTSVAKPIQWKVFLKISIKTIGSWKNWRENRKEWREKGRWMERIEYFPSSSQKYINLHNLYFLCIYTITVLPSLLPINILQWRNRNIWYFKHGLE